MLILVSKISIFSWKIRHCNNNFENISDDVRVIDFNIEQICKHPKYNGTAHFDIAV